MPTWPTTPVPHSVDELIPRVQIATYVPDQQGYEIRRRVGTSIKSEYALSYFAISGPDRNTLRHFIQNDIDFGALEFDWTMPERNAMSIASIATDTVTTTHAQYFSVGQWVTISQTTAADGNYRVATITNSTTLTLAGLSATESTGLIRPHLPAALIQLESGRIRNHEKLIGPIRDQYGLWNWSVTIVGVNT